MTARADLDTKLKGQFSIRSQEFDISANWIGDEKLIRAHIDLSGDPSGEVLDLCCGTGRIGRALKAKGWDVRGLDICDDMVKISSTHFPVSCGKAEKLPFEQGRFHAVVCRQAFQFLNVQEVLAEIARVLVPGGTFVISLTVPFSEKDRVCLQEIHRIKQPLLLRFYTAEDLMEELRQAGFVITETRNLKVRESVTKWMKYAPELSEETKQKVIAAVKNAPDIYKKLHNVEAMGAEVFEDWNWVVLKTTFRK